MLSFFVSFIEQELIEFDCFEYFCLMKVPFNGIC